MDGCPKRMVYGPCGGVRDDLSCEMVPDRCVFVDVPPLAWGQPNRRTPLPLPRPFVVTDLTVRPYDADSVSEVTRCLAGTCDAVLVGEHQSRPDFPPTVMAGLITAAGGRPWLTLTCRDRNRVVLEQEAEGLRLTGAAGVLCVTGDGRAHGTRPDVTQVFDLDSTRLAALVAGTGLPVAVAEAPDAAPSTHRPLRLLAKEQAGAQVCFLNATGTPERVAEFVQEARSVGVTVPFVAGVAVFTDERSARVLQAFPGLHLPEEHVQSVLEAPDPVQAGIDAAIAEARALLAVDGVVGVNLSGLASARGELAGADIKARVGSALRVEAA